MWAGNIGSQSPANIHQNIIYIIYIVQKKANKRKDGILCKTKQTNKTSKQ